MVWILRRKCHSILLHCACEDCSSNMFIVLWFYAFGLILLYPDKVSTIEHCQHLNVIKGFNHASFHIIGFFPVNNEFPSELSADGILKSVVMKYILEEHNDKNPDKPIGYAMYDTCSPDEFDITTDAVMSLMLSSTDELNNQSLMEDSCHCLYKERHHILGIVGPSISSKTAHVNKILGYHRLPMVSYGSTSPELSDSEKYPLLFRTILPDIYQAYLFESFLFFSNWTYISILNSDDSYGRNGAHALSKSNLICLFLKASIMYPLKENYIKSVLLRLKANTNANVIVLWGHFNLVQSILMKAAYYGVHNKTWIVSEVSGRKQWFVSETNQLVGNIIVVVPNGGRLKKFEDYFFKQTYKMSRGNPWLQNFFHVHGVNRTHSNERLLMHYRSMFELEEVGFVRNAVLTYLEAFSKNFVIHGQKTFDHFNFVNMLTETQFRGLHNESISFDRNGDLKSGAYKLYIAAHDKQEKFKLIATWSSENGLSLKKEFYSLNISKTKSICSKNCSAGFSPLFNQLKRCCWKCIECAENHIKVGPGLHSCEKCPLYHVPNKERTRCIPLSEGYLNSDMPEGVSIYIFSSFGIFITLIIFGILVAARNTQVVRSSNLYPSMVQLIGHFLLFLVPELFLGKDTFTKCITRTFGAGLLFVFVVGVTLIKVIHISSLFRFTHRISRKEKFQLTTKMVVISITCVLVDAFIALIMIHIEPVKILNIYDSFEVHSYCTTEYHIKGQLLFISFLQLFCCIYAFRARKLPDSYNESKHIAFAMFASNVVIVLAIPLILSYEKPKDRNFIYSMVIIIANLLLLLIHYSNKMVLICFHPEKNMVLHRTGMSEGNKRKLTGFTFSSSSTRFSSL